MRSTKSLLPVILICAALFSCAERDEKPDSHLEPFLGKWQLDYDHSFALAIANEKTVVTDSTAVSQYVTHMCKIMKLELTDSTMIYGRGKQVREFPYQIDSLAVNRLSIRADLPELTYLLTFSLDDEGYLSMNSSWEKFQQMFVFKKAAEALPSSASP